MLLYLCFLSVLLDGVKEEKIDMLRAILAQFEYQYQVRLWDSKGVPFRTYMYVPEIHPITGEEFHERDDLPCTNGSEKTICPGCRDIVF